jgi:hypothetical protein
MTPEQFRKFRKIWKTSKNSGKARKLMKLWGTQETRERLWTFSPIYTLTYVNVQPLVLPQS